MAEEKKANTGKVLIIGISVVTVVLALVAAVTAVKLYMLGKDTDSPEAVSKNNQLAEAVPEIFQAAENVCETSFTLGSSPSPTPSPSPSPTPSPTPTPTPTPTPSPSPSPTPSPTPTPTPTPGPPASPPPGCYESCVVDADCIGTLICSGGLCVNEACPSEPDCICDVGGPEVVEEVQLPEAGITLPTIGLLTAGVATLLLGALALLL